jgi:uncharacterized protein YecT (DUF1311 family)
MATMDSWIMNKQLGSLGVAAFLAVSSSGAFAQEPNQDCDAYYYGIRRAQDFKRAFACEMRAPDENKNWAILAVMYLNGDGTEKNVKKARAAFKHLDSHDASSAALENALGRREANPTFAFPRIDYCKEIAQTTLDGNTCDGIQQRLANVVAKGALKTAGAALDKVASKHFGELKRAFDAFRKADGLRVYAAYGEGSIRDEASTDQENLVQRDFLTAVDAWGPKASAPPAPKRSLADADKELNKVYRALMESYDAAAAEAVKTYPNPEVQKEMVEASKSAKNAARDAQRAWLKYAASWKKFAEALRPDEPRADDVRAFLIEQRISELKGGGEEGGKKE